MEILKILTSAVLISLASELGKRSGKLGGLLLSLPITSLLAILWLWFETKDSAKIVEISTATLVFILPSLVFFIALPLLLTRDISFFPSFGMSIILTLMAYAIFFNFRNF